MAKRRRKSRRKGLSLKRFLIILVLFVVSIPLVVGMGLKWWLDEDKLVDLLEDNLNARVEVESVKLHIFSLPPEIHLDRLSIAPRESNGELQDPTILLEKGTLAVELMPLLKRRLDLRSIDFSGGRINYIIAKNGSDNLTPLFHSPEEAESDPEDDAKAPQSTSGEDVNVEELSWGVGMRSINLENLEIDVRILSADLQIQCNDFDLQARDIELDPRELVTANRAKLAFQGRANVDSRSTPVIHYGSAEIDATLISRIFDPGSGDFDPDVEARILLGDGSYLSTKVPTIQAWWSKLAVLNRLGMEIGELPEKANFDQHPVNLHYAGDVITLREQLNMELADWQLALMPPSVCNIASTEHAIKAELRTSKIHGTLIIDLIDSFIKSSPKFLRDTLRQELLENKVRDGRLILKAKSEGTFDDPEVGLDSPLPDEKSLLDRAKSNLDELRRGLFD